MSPNVSGFRWSPLKERAAVLVAEDDLSDAAIADTLGINRRQLTRWRQHPEFAARVAEHVAAVQAAMMRLAISKKHKRVEILDEQAAKIRAVIAARAADPLMADVPGGTTGLLVPEPMLIKVYESNDVEGDDDADGILTPTKKVLLVYKHAVDTATLKELRATLEDAAKELGQRVEKREVSGKDGAAVQHEVTHRIDYSALSDEELDVLDRIASRDRPGGDPAGEGTS